MDNLNDEKEYLKTLMNFFAAIKQLCTFYSFEQAIDAMDIYFKTGDETYLTKENGIREFVVSNKIREKMLPVIGSKYEHLEDFLVDFSSPNKKSR